MGALPHCTPIFPSLSCWPPTLQSRSHNTSASELAKADSALYPENPQFNSQSIPRTHGMARHGRRGSAPPLPLSVHLGTNSKTRFPSLRPPARRRKSTPSCWDRVQRSGAGSARPSRTPSEGGPLQGQQSSPVPGLPARPPPRPGLLPAAPGVPEGSARGPASPPRPQLPYLQGPPERVEGTVQQQGGPAVAEQPQQLPEQHPSWAGGRGCGLRATWGGSRASRQQRRWLAPIPGARLSQL